MVIVSIGKNQKDRRPERTTRPDLESGFRSQPVAHLDGARSISHTMEPRKVEPSFTSAPAAKTFPTTEEIPFHRTKRGIILFIIIGIVILAAIIGGAVGGTLNKTTQSSQPLSLPRLSSTTVSRQGQSNGNGSPVTSATPVVVETMVVSTTTVGSSAPFSLPSVT